MAPSNILVLEHAFSYGCSSIKNVSIETINLSSQLKFDHESNVFSFDHVWSFLLKCKLFGIIDDDALVSKLFTRTLQGRIKWWLESLPSQSIHYCEQLLDLFLTSHHNYNCNALRSELENFCMYQGETLKQFLSIFMKICFIFCKDDISSHILHYFYNSLHLSSSFHKLNSDELQSILSNNHDTESIHVDDI